MREAPAVAAAHETYGSDVTFVGLAGRDSLSAIQDFVDERGVDGFTHLIDDDGAIWDNFKVPTQPAFVFIGDDGATELLIRPLGEEGLAEKLEALIAA